MADTSPQCSSIANADSAHNSAKGSSNSTSNGHKLLIVIERKLLSFIAYRHQASNDTSCSSASGRQISTISGHKLLIVLERKCLSVITNCHKLSDEPIIGFDRVRNADVINRLTETNRQEQFASHILH